MKTQASEDRRLLADVSRLSFPRSEACALHMTRMWRVSTGWKQLCLTSISLVKPSREIPARHSVLLVCTIWYTFSIPSLYIPILPTNVKESFWEKTLQKYLRVRNCYTNNFLQICLWNFLISYLSISIPLRGWWPKHLPHHLRVSREVLVLLGSIGRSQGWQMQHGACYEIQRARQDTIPKALLE